MNKQLFEIPSTIGLEAFYGPQNKNIEALKSHFTKLKLVARGSVITAFGSKVDLTVFETTFLKILAHLEHYNSFDAALLPALMLQTKPLEVESHTESLILYGNFGKAIKALTENQKKIVSCVAAKDMVFVIGAAGTGKTYTSVALAVKALRDKQVKRIILTRPAVEAGENLGFLPGDIKEKLDPYMQPLYDALEDMIPSEKLKYYLENRVIQIAPLAFMRGRTLDEAFVILDEAQNTTPLQMKMFLTRMGKSAKFIITGDIEQIDLPKKLTSGLIEATALLKNIPGIDIIHLDSRDVLRHRLVKEIVLAYQKKEHTS